LRGIGFVRYLGGWHYVEAANSTGILKVCIWRFMIRYRSTSIIHFISFKLISIIVSIIFNCTLNFVASMAYVCFTAVAWVPAQLKLDLLNMLSRYLNISLRSVIRPIEIVLLILLLLLIDHHRLLLLVWMTSGRVIIVVSLLTVWLFRPVIITLLLISVLWRNRTFWNMLTFCVILWLLSSAQLTFVAGVFFLFSGKFMW